MDMENEIVQIAQSSSIKPLSSGVRILVVDDDVTFLKIVETMLKACEYEVVTVKSAYDALFTLWENQGVFDLVLMDVHMHDMDGISLLEHIKLEFNLPVVMLSDDDHLDAMMTCLQSGASFYLVKPPSIRDLESLWQFVYLKRIADMTEIEQTESAPQASPPETESEDESECTSSDNENNLKEKDEETKEDEDEPSNQKKPRLLWNVGLHLQGFPPIPEQQHAYTTLQPTLGSCSMPQSTYGSSLPMSSQGKLKQPLLDTGSSHSQQNDADYSGFTMEPHNTGMGSSFCGNSSTGLVTSTDTSQMINQQPLVRMGHFSNGSLDHNFNTSSISRNINQSIGSMGVFSNLNYAGIQMTNTSDMIDLNQMPVGYGESDGKNCSCNMMDEICRGNMTLGAAGKSPLIPEFTLLHSDYGTQWIGSSSVFASENHTPSMFTNVIQQPPVPSLLLPQQQQNDIGVEEQVDSQSIVLQSLGESDLSNKIFKQGDQFSSNKFVKK